MAQFTALDALIAINNTKIYVILTENPKLLIVLVGFEHSHLLAEQFIKEIIELVVTVFFKLSN